MSLQATNVPINFLGHTSVAVRPSSQAFADAVGRLERQTSRLPGEREIAEEFQWAYSQAALIALAQEAKAAGLVRVYYEDANGERRYAQVPSPRAA